MMVPEAMRSGRSLKDQSYGGEPEILEETKVFGVNKCGELLKAGVLTVLFDCFLKLENNFRERLLFFRSPNILYT